MALSPCAAEATSFPVTANGDFGIGTLRQAILDANLGCTGSDSIDFSGGPFTIAVSSSLPYVNCGGLVFNGDGSQIIASPLYGGPLYGNGITVFASPKVTVNNLEISGFSYGSGIWGFVDASGNKLHGCSIGITPRGVGAQVIGNEIYSNQTGIYVSYGGSTIQGNTIYANLSDGIDVESVPANIVGNTIGFDKTGAISGNGDGIYLYNNASTVNDNTISGNGTGIYVDLDNGSQITGNRIGTNPSGNSLSDPASRYTGNSTGIYVSFGYGGTSIGGNTIAGGTGIDLSNASGVSIDSNFMGTDVSGGNFLGISEGINANCSSGLTVNNNTVATSYGGTGIQFSGVAGGGSTTITSNRIGFAGDGITPLGNNSYGVILNSSFCGDILTWSRSITVGGNTIGNQDVYGIGLAGADDVTVSGNTIRSSRVTGIRLYHVTGSISGNTVSGNNISGSGDGIELWGDLADITGNTITGNSGAGIAVEANAANITGNTITGNASYGIDVYTGMNDQMSGNLIYGNAGSIIPAGQKNINLGFYGGPRPPNSGGPNSGQNYPVIDSVTRDVPNNWTLVSFTLDATPGTYLIEIFGNNPATTVPGGNLALGSTFLSVLKGGTSASGSFAIPGLSADSISLLATHVESYETSEYSPVATVATAPGVSISPPALDFGDQTIGTDSSAQVVTLTSNGTADYRLDAAGDTTCYGGAICSSGAFTCTTTCAPGFYTPGQSCQLTATFHPLATGPFSTTIAICDNVTDHSTGPSRTLVISGNGVTAPPPPTAQVDIAPPTFDYGPVSIGSTSPPNAFTVSNTGTAPADLGSLSTSSTDFVMNGTTCGATLPAASSCSASVSFAPSSLGPVSATLSVSWSTGTPPAARAKGARAPRVTAATTASATLMGTGIAAPPPPVANVDIVPASFNFGTVTQGSTGAANTFTIRNTGTASASLGSASTSAGFTLGSTTCGSTLAAGSNCSADVSFAPTTVGSVTGTLSMGWNGGLTAFSDLSGTGAAAPVTTVDISPAPFDFGTVLLGQTSDPQTFSIRNTGGSSTSISSVTGSAGFVVNTSSCGGPLAAGASCFASVSFTPTRFGTISGLLTVDGPSATLGTASLTGTGDQEATLDLPTAIDFGAYTSGAPAVRRTVTLRANGNAVLSISSLFVTGPFALGNGCPSSLDPGDSCTLTLDFSAPAVGDYVGSLVIATNAVGGSGSIALTARTVAAAVAQIRVSPTSIGFGDRLLGIASPAQRVTVTNIGNAAATVPPPTTSNNDFLVTTTCGGTLLPAASCFADVSFRPAGFGRRTGQLTVSSSTGSPIAVSLAGTGCPPVLGSVNRQGGQKGCAP